MPGGRGGLAFALATCSCLATGTCNKRMRSSCCRSRCGYTSQGRWPGRCTPVFSAHGRGARAERPNTFRPGGVVAPEVAGLLSKASPVPSTAPLPSFPSPNPPHLLTVIGLLCAGEQFVSNSLSSSRLHGSRVRLRAGGSSASLLALGSGSRRCRRRGDSSSGAAPRACYTCCCARRCSSRIWRHVHGFACFFASHAQAVLAAHSHVYFAGTIVRVCVVRVADRPTRRKLLVCASNNTYRCVVHV